jgi:type IV pilus assembly protein PilF
MRIAAILLALLVAGCTAQTIIGPDGEITTRAHASAKIHTELAAQYYERAQLGIALDELRQALQSEPDYAPAYNVRGLVHMALREDKEAEEDFQHSLRLDSASPDTHNNYGWFLCQRGREHESVKMFLAALKDPLYTTPEKAYLNAGICSQKAGELKDAEEFLQKAILFRPDLPDAMLALAELDLAKGDFPGAKSYFLRYAQDNNALTAENLWLGVRIERGLGDKNAEDSYALQLRKRFPGSPESKLLPAEQ